MSVPRKVKSFTTKANTQLSALHPHAAGIDIGATHLQVAVPCDADPKPVRTFTTFFAVSIRVHPSRSQDSWLKKFDAGARRFIFGA